MIAQPKLTLRFAYQTFLSPEHKPKTRETYRGLLKHWEAAPLSLPGGKPHLRIDCRDPELYLVDNVTLLGFKGYLASRLSQNTVRSKLKHLAAIFNRIGPADRRFPEALGLLSRVPFVKPPKEILRKVVTFQDAELESLYQAAESATWPNCEVQPVWWWRALLVMLFNVGLRRLDYLSARQAEFDLVRGLVRFSAEKTGKESELPLHPVVVEHLNRIWEPRRVLVWPWRWNQSAPDHIDKRKTSLYGQWHRLRKAAGIERKLTPHDLRRTCGSGLFAKSPAAASECLQHASITTTQRSYADCSRETAALMLAREQPSAFTGDDSDGLILPFPGVG